MLPEKFVKGTAFPVMGSFEELNEAINFAKKIEGKASQYKPEIYLAENNYYGVTLGGYLAMKEAIERTKYARRENIANDAYIYSSPNWGENLFK